jgi:2'-hydroxyisoflavone reductase
MKLLLIGGTSFAGRAAVEGAVDRGHDVTVFHRGEHEPEGLAGVEHIHGTRDGGLDALRGRTWDAALDMCGYVPRVVRASAQLLADAVGTYCFVSSLSVLPDDAFAGANEDTPVHQPPFPDTEEITGESYGPLKVACELEAQAAFPGRCLVIRPGYIVGPNDPSDRFTYWIRRARMGGEILAPGPQDGDLQAIDARDLGGFMLDHLEAGTFDVFGVTGPADPLTWGAFLPLACEGAASDAILTWVDQGFLQTELGEEIDDALPLRDYPYQGLHRYDVGKAIAAGLSFRPLAETIADTIEWDAGRDQAQPMRAGLTPIRERDLLASWHASPANG